MVRIFGRTIFHAVGAARAIIFDNVPGLFRERDVKISRLPIDSINFRVGEDFNVRMPADLDQLGCENSHRAVVGREGLVELRHVPTDAGRFLDQVDLKASVGEIERRLNAADATADHHHIADVIVLKFLAHLHS